MRQSMRLGLLLPLLLAGCEHPPEMQHLQGFTQGTTWHVSWWAENDAVPALELQSALNAELTRIDQQLSNYRPDSVIEHFNRQTETTPIEVGSEIVDLFRLAKGVSVASEGCYDLSIGQLFRAWGFASDKLTPPDAATLEQLRGMTGIDKVRTTSDTALQKDLPGLQLDLSSIGQGYSVQRLAELLEERGIQHYLVEIGGEMQVHGHKPNDQPWRVAVERPAPGERKIQKIITVKNDEAVAIMTSGTYRHFFDANGKRYAHILDARTGQPVTHNLVSVTVLHEDASLADAWSTALLCLGPDQALRVANAMQVPALLISLDGDSFNEQTSNALNAPERWQIE